MSWHQFAHPDGSPYGSCEVFYLNPAQAWELLGDSLEVSEDGAHLTLEGWYWHACYPGCLPDSEPVGPFQSEKECLGDAEVAE